MGIVKRQSIKQSIVVYVGILIGMVNLLYIYPKYLEKEQLGILNFITSNAAALAPIIMFGAASLVIRFFPVFKDEKKGHHGFLPLLLVLVLTGFIIFCLLTFAFRSPLLAIYAKKSELYLKYLPYTIPLVLMLALSETLTAYISNFHRIVVPKILSYLTIKIVQPILVILLFFGVISFTSFFNNLIIVYFLILISLFIYLKWLGQLSLKFEPSFLNKELKKEMTTYATYGVLGSLGTNLATRIDVFMVGTMIDLGGVAVYTIALLISEVIDVPRRAIHNIISPIVAEASIDKDFKKIKELYIQTSINQLIIGVLILIGIWASIDDLFILMPNGEDYADGKYVVIILGSAALVDLATGINSHIIGYSKHFRFNFYLILIMAVINVVNNVILIPIYWIYGAALATFLSKTIYNLLKTWYVWNKMKIHPFSKNTFVVLLLGVVVYFISQIIPLTSMTFLNIIIKSALITFLFLGSIVLFRLSPDVDATVKWLLEKVRKG